MSFEHERAYFPPHFGQEGKTMMKNLMVRFWLVLVMFGHLPIAKAQTALQPIYTRPAKSEPFRQWNNTALSTITSGEYSSFIDVTGFNSIQVTLIMSHPPASCTHLLQLYIFGSNDLSSVVRIDDPRAIMTIGGESDEKTTWTYVVPAPTKYVKAFVRGILGPGVEACSVDVWLTLLPTSPDPTPAFSAQFSQWQLAELDSAEASQLNSTSYSATEFTVQNNSDVVVYCGFDSTVSSSKYAVALSAGSAAKDGTGGSWTLNNYQGVIWCIPASGSGKAVSYYRL